MLAGIFLISIYQEEGSGNKLGMWMIGLLLFLVLGSAIFQILQTMGTSLFRN